MVKPLVNSSNDFSPLVISFQRPSFLCTSSCLSSTLFSSLSYPLNTLKLVLTHLTSVPPVHFLLSPVEVTQLQTFLFRPVELPSILSWFQNSIVFPFSCHVLSFNPTGLLAVAWRSNVQARLGRSIFSMHKVPQHMQTTIALQHTTVEHIAVMHQLQCTKCRDTCKTQ